MLCFFIASYMFKSSEKAALQEIGPRFTLKLRSLKKGLPAVHNLGVAPPKLEIAPEDDSPGDDRTDADFSNMDGSIQPKKGEAPTTEEEFLWVWKVAILLSHHPLNPY